MLASSQLSPVNNILGHPNPPLRSGPNKYLSNEGWVRRPRSCSRIRRFGLGWSSDAFVVTAVVDFGFVTILLYPLPLLRALLVCSAIPKSPLTKLTFAALFSHGALACHCHTPVVPRAYPDARRALYCPHGDGAAACSKKNLEQRTSVFAASLSSCQEPSSARHEAVLPDDTSQ